MFWKCDIFRSASKVVTWWILFLRSLWTNKTLDLLPRQWVVVDGKGTIVTVRKEGTMLHLNLSLHDDGVHVDGEGMSTLVLSTSAQKRDTESQTSIT